MTGQPPPLSPDEYFKDFILTTRDMDAWWTSISESILPFDMQRLVKDAEKRNPELQFYVLAAELDKFHRGQTVTKVSKVANGRFALWPEFTHNRSLSFYPSIYRNSLSNTTNNTSNTSRPQYRLINFSCSTRKMGGNLCAPSSVSPFPILRIRG